MWGNEARIPLEAFVTGNCVVGIIVVVCLTHKGLTWSTFEIRPSVRAVQRHTATWLWTGQGNKLKTNSLVVVEARVSKMRS